MTRTLIILLALICFIAACRDNSKKEGNSVEKNEPQQGTYGYDRSFLEKQGVSIVELINQDSSARVLLSATWQGRVMTSTAMGDSGKSFGWLNYDLLQARDKKKQFNPIGGEERFWIGPEGGQYSFYFNKGDSFDISHWQVPAIIDTTAYDLVKSDQSQAIFSAKAQLSNYSGATFDFDIERKINLLDKNELGQQLGTNLGTDLHCVAYQTTNTITNTGENDWQKQKGLISIWLLGMFSPSPQTTVIIPFHPLPNARDLITNNYFGTVPPERLEIKDSVLFFTCDGKYRSKIGLSPLVAKPVAASYDFASNTLTLVLPEIHKDAAYVNSKWEIQQQPYRGDVINSYNDGPLADGTQMGPFYEIESSSPALELRKGKTGSYVQTTCHLQGAYPSMKTIARQLLGVDLDSIKK